MMMGNRLLLCRVCGKPFVGKKKRSVLCSRGCCKKKPGDETVLSRGGRRYMCVVCYRTVAKWCDGGLLPHWRAPFGTKHSDRRISRTGNVLALR